jgi:hypothetical protein
MLREGMDASAALTQANTEAAVEVVDPFYWCKTSKLKLHSFFLEYSNISKVRSFESFNFVSFSTEKELFLSYSPLTNRSSNWRDSLLKTENNWVMWQKSRPRFCFI